MNYKFLNKEFKDASNSVDRIIENVKSEILEMSDLIDRCKDLKKIIISQDRKRKTADFRAGQAARVRHWRARRKLATVVEQRVA